MAGDTPCLKPNFLTWYIQLCYKLISSLPVVVIGNSGTSVNSAGFISGKGKS